MPPSLPELLESDSSLGGGEPCPVALPSGAVELLPGDAGAAAEDAGAAAEDAGSPAAGEEDSVGGGASVAPPAAQTFAGSAVESTAASAASGESGREATLR